MKIVLAVSVVLLLIASPLVARSYRKSQEQGARGLRVRVGATPEESRAGRQGQLWAVVIGVSRYKLGDQSIGGAKIPNLQYAASDAQSIYDFLRSPEGGSFVPESEGGNLILLTDDEASRSNIEKALAKLEGSKPEDYFVIYIAAHGSNVPVKNPETSRVEQIPYFFVFDSDPEDVARTAVRMQSFQDALKRIPARRGLILADTCHSAGVQLAGRGLDVVETKQANSSLIQSLQKIEGVGSISAAEPTELSYEIDDLGHGAFTYCLLDGFRGRADADRNGSVTFSEIRSYLRTAVPKLTDDKQHPFATITSVEISDLTLARVSYAEKQVIGNYATGLGVLVVRTPDIDGVLMAIDDEPPEMLTARTEHPRNVVAGTKTLTFSKGSVKQTSQVMVSPGKTKYVEVNLAFSKDESDDLDGPNEAQVNVFLDEPKEPSSEVIELYQKGVESFNKQKFETAIEYLNRAFASSGNTNCDVLVFIGRAQQSLGRNESAARTFEAALRIRPDHQSRILLAEARLKSGYNLDEINKDLRAIIRSHPNDSLARTIYADLLLKQVARLNRASDSLTQGYFFEAEKNARHAIRIKPLSPPAHMVLSEVLTHQKSKAKQKEAVEAAEKAIQLLDQLSRKLVSASRGLKRLSFSHIVFGGGRYVNSAALAEAHYLAAKSINNLCNGDDAPPESSSLLDRGLAHAQEARKLAQANRDNVRLMLVLDVSAKINFLKANDSMAIRDAEQALQVMEATPELKARDYADPHYILSLAYENQQKFAKAFERLQRYLELARSTMPAADLLAEEDRLKRLKREMQANRQ